ncbi:MAG: TlpA family protein disulfide reductase [Bacteroidia bacterium]
MMRVLLLIFILIFSTLRVEAQEFITESRLDQLVRNNNDTLYVVNFWATWCKPCIEEMPYFIHLSDSLKNQPVEFIFISMDFKSQHERVKEFVAKKALSNRVYQLIPANADEFINSVDETWSGAIPATIYYRSGQKLYFYEGEYEAFRLSSTILNLLEK